MSTAATETKKSLADVARISDLTGIGWSVKEEDDGTFTAHEKDGELRSVGPASSIKALHTQVMLAAGQPNGKGGEDFELSNGDNPKKGKKHKVTQPILTGTEDAVFADMETAGRDYRITTMEILRLQKIQKTQGDTLEKLMAKFEDELEYDPASKERFFTVTVEGESVDIVDETTETHKIKTRKSEK